MLASWHFEWIRAMLVSGHVCGSGTDSWYCVLLSFGFLFSPSSVQRPLYGFLLGFVHNTCPLSMSHSAPKHCIFSCPTQPHLEAPIPVCSFIGIVGTKGAPAWKTAPAWLSCSTVDLSLYKVTAVDCGAKVCLDGRTFGAGLLKGDIGNDFNNLIYVCCDEGLSGNKSHYRLSWCLIHFPWLSKHSSEICLASPHVYVCEDSQSSSSWSW